MSTLFNSKDRNNRMSHIFSMDGVEEILNIQPVGSNAKSYQIRKVRDMIVRYNLTLED